MPPCWKLAQWRCAKCVYGGGEEFDYQNVYREFLPRYGERANRARAERCRRKVSKWKPRYRRSVTQKAIEYADDDHRLKKLHDTIDEDAFNARLMRRGEI